MTMMAMNVVLGNPAILSDSVLAAAAVAEAEADAVTRTTVELREAVTTLVWTERAVEVGAEDEASSVEEEAAAATSASAEGEGWASSEVTISSTGLGETEAAAAEDSWLLVYITTNSGRGRTTTTAEDCAEVGATLEGALTAVKAVPTASTAVGLALVTAAEDITTVEELS